MVIMETTKKEYLKPTVNDVNVEITTFEPIARSNELAKGTGWDDGTADWKDEDDGFDW